MRPRLLEYGYLGVLAKHSAGRRPVVSRARVWPGSSVSASIRGLLGRLVRHTRTGTQVHTLTCATSEHSSSLFYRQLLLCHVALPTTGPHKASAGHLLRYEENRPPTHRRAPAHRPAAPPPNWQLRVARPAPGPQARALFAGAATIPRRGRALRLGPEPTDRVRGGARQNSQQLVPRPPDPRPVRDAPPPRALYFAPSLQPRSPASASAASAHRAAGRQLLSTQPTGAGRGARLR